MRYIKYFQHGELPNLEQKELVKKELLKSVTVKEVNNQVRKLDQL